MLGLGHFCIFLVEEQCLVLLTGTFWVIGYSCNCWNRGIASVQAEETIKRLKGKLRFPWAVLKHFYLFLLF